MQSRFIVVGSLITVFVAVVVFATRNNDDASLLVAPATQAATSLPTLSPTPLGREHLVGSETCVGCHKTQGDAYRQSHHARALVDANTARAALDDARFDDRQLTTSVGGTTRFVLQDGKPMVITPTEREASTSLPVAYVAGVWPLQQYVVATERGKLQALGVAWDSRSTAEGGEHWFHVYGPDGVAPNDARFFTAAAQSWNHMCAECHSTWAERRYDLNADRFDTRWAELSVGCEACHGPGRDHVRSARAGKGAVVPLSARLQRSAPWMPSGQGSPIPHAQDGVEVEVCAPCHSRREPLKEGFVAGDPLLNFFEPELLWPGRYHADGQVEGEVFEWASFLQSRMYQAGVRCSDCHEPHSGKLRAQDNALCTGCHESARFDTERHTHHAQHVVGEGATRGPSRESPQCVDCHMPPSTFMQIDERRDHSIRIPRPDHSVRFGTPNACNGCHVQESATWAQGQVAAWFPASQARPHFVEALGRDRQGTVDAPRALRKVADDIRITSIARATALERLGRYAGPQTLEALRSALDSGQAIVVFGAVLGAAQLPARERASLLEPALEHPMRAVRIAAARALASLPKTALSTRAQRAIEPAFHEVIESFAVSASRPETHVELGAFELARGRLIEAHDALQTALRLQPCLVEAQLNLAELARQRGDEHAALHEIQQALLCSPQSAPSHHALGLWQVRARRLELALSSLRKAVELAPDTARFSYVLAVALAGEGEREEAIGVLDAALARRPNDTSNLQLLAAYLREDGQRQRALEAQQKVNAVLGE